jgi:2-oxoisovalerate dehydrogenase E2 component (dihydrolipoyl transacylase)
MKLNRCFNFSKFHNVSQQKLVSFQKQNFNKNSFKFQPLIPFNLADIGEGIKEVEIIQWFIKEGETIQQFDKVAEVQSDKANVEITSRFEGVIKKLYYKAGDIAQVGYPLIDIDVEDSKVEIVEKKEKSEISKQNVEKKETSETSSEKFKTTPSVRRIAREENINLSNVEATGKDGRILKQDVLNYLDNSKAPQGTSCSITTNVEKKETSFVTVSEEDEQVPVRGLMRTMIKTMEAASQVPHLGYSDEIFMDELIELRKKLKKSAEERGIKLSFMPFFIKAASLSLKQYPIVNSQLSSDKSILIYKVFPFELTF